MGLPAHATRVWYRARRVGLRGRANTTLFACCQQGDLHRFGAGHLTGLQHGLAYGLYAGLGGPVLGPCWPDFGPCWGFAGFAIEWRGAAGLAMPVFTVYPHSAGWLYSV